MACDSIAELEVVEMCYGIKNHLIKELELNYLYRQNQTNKCNINHQFTVYLALQI